MQEQKIESKKYQPEIVAGIVDAQKNQMLTKMELCRVERLAQEKSASVTTQILDKREHTFKRQIKKICQKLVVIDQIK